MSLRFAVAPLVLALVPSCGAPREPLVASAPLAEVDVERQLPPPAASPQLNAEPEPASDGAPTAQEREVGLRWRFRAGSPTPGIAIDAQGGIYIPTQEGHVHALTADGGFRWAFNCGAPATGVGVNRAGAVIVGTADGVLHAILPVGTLLWQYRAPFALRTTLAIGGDGTSYVGDAEGYVLAVSPYGSARWRAPIAGGLTAGPTLLPSGEIVVATGAGELAFVDGVLARRTWAVGGTMAQTPEVLADGTLLVVTGGALVGVREGAEAFRRPGVDAVAASGAGAVTVGVGGLCWIDSRGAASGCVPLAVTSSARPVVDPAGWVYVPTAEGRLVVVSQAGGVARSVPVARSALLGPVLDVAHGQVLAAAGDGVVGAVALAEAP